MTSRYLVHHFRVLSTSYRLSRLRLEELRWFLRAALAAEHSAPNISLPKVASCGAALGSNL